MDGFAAFLKDLLHDGKVVFPGHPLPRSGVSEAALGVLNAAFERDQLDVAGPAIPFDPSRAAEAGELVRQACWALVRRDERVANLERRLTLSRFPMTASDHISTDLLLRYLPTVHRRARALDPSDPLVEILARVLRRCPLSGVLSDLDDGPLAPLDFGGHPGLLLLYAERLAAHDRRVWQPSGPGAEFVELVTLAGGICKADRRDGR